MQPQVLTSDIHLVTDKSLITESGFLKFYYIKIIFMHLHPYLDALSYTTPQPSLIILKD